MLTFNLAGHHVPAMETRTCGPLETCNHHGKLEFDHFDQLFKEPCDRWEPENTSPHILRSIIFAKHRPQYLTNEMTWEHHFVIMHIVFELEEYLCIF